MAATYVFAGICVVDIVNARTWYERFMGREPDLVPNDNEAAWEVTSTGWIYIIGDAGHAGGSLSTVLVDDLDQRLGDWKARGIEPGPVETNEGGVRTTVITDPDGNRLQFGQVPEADDEPKDEPASDS